MGARLAYAKVVDRQLFYARGGRVTPGLENDVVAKGLPGPSAAFLVLRAWTDDEGAFTESWRIESPSGSVLHEGAPRELHLATRSAIAELSDEIPELQFEYESDDYVVVFSIDDNEVARASFRVRVGEEPGLES